MAKSATQPPAPTATQPPAPTAVAVALRNRPFIGGAGNGTVAMVHKDHGDAQVGDWQVEEFATLGWSLKA